MFLLSVRHLPTPLHHLIRLFFPFLLPIELLIDDTNNKLHRRGFFSLSAFCFGNQIHATNHRRRKSCTYINDLSYSQSIAASQTVAIAKDMLACQQKPIVDSDSRSQKQDNQVDSINFLTCAELSVYMTLETNDRNEKLLIIDCGRPLRYSERRIKDSFLLNVSDKLSRKRFMNRGLTNFLDKNQLNRLNKSDIIVLYDDSTHSSPCSNLTIQQISPIMKRILDDIKLYDSNKTSYILQSSFDEFYEHYPTLCYISSINSDYHDSASLHTTDIESYTMTEILPGLYLGNARDAKDINLLKQNQIKSIINISTSIPCYYENEVLFDYLKLPCNDSGQDNILDYFETTLKYINEKLSVKQNVLVHCQGGISRSPSFIIGYLMKYHSKTFEQAYSFVKDKRQMIGPNLGFLNQLTRYEQILASSVQ